MLKITLSLHSVVVILAQDQMNEPELKVESWSDEQGRMSKLIDFN